MLFCDGATEISNKCSIFRKKVGPLKRNGASCLNKTDLKNNENIISTSIICYNGTLATIKVLKNMAKVQLVVRLEKMHNSKFIQLIEYKLNGLAD